jgi:hypothetical protein
MRVLQDALESALENVPEQILDALLAKKLTEQKLQLTDKEIVRLRQAILASPSDTPTVKSWRPRSRQSVSIRITGDEVDQAAGRLTERLPDIIEDVATQSAERILGTLDRRWPTQRRHEANAQRSFETRLRKRWGSGFQHLQMMLVIARGLGEGLNAELRRPGFPEPHKMDILTRLHARGCQVTNEVIVLLKSGFADGAMARWRTLHEIATIALFISVHDDELAERYSLHNVVESRRARRDYFACQERLGYEPMTASELHELDATYEALLQKYGQPFGEEYGWAAEVLRKKRPSFRDIECAAGIDHLRAHYRLASHNVHANPKGVFFKLGLLEEDNVLLAGPSNTGLSEPGQCAAISLLQVSAPIVTIHPTLDGVVALRMLQTIVDRTCDAFHKSRQQSADDSA